MVVCRIGYSRMPVALVFATVWTAEIPEITGGVGTHTFDGKYPIETINLSVVYLVPKDRTPLVNWRERVDYFLKRIDAFHRRESAGRSRLLIQLHPEPLLVGKTSRGDQGHGSESNLRSFDARGALGPEMAPRRSRVPDPAGPQRHQPARAGRLLSDARGQRCPDLRGEYRRAGEAFSRGGVGQHRATYHADEGLGMGLVSTDGWRVPYSGSDCVVYHEGIGHPIGLPHPEPADDSVMGTGQYRYWIIQTWVTASQKKALGWLAGSKEEPGKPPSRQPTKDLFSAFTAIPRPIAPAHNELVSLDFTWPADAKLREIKIRVQTELRGPWQSIPIQTDVKPPTSLPIGSFDRPTPVSYRVDVVLEDGQAAELWGYFQVAKRR